MEHTKKETEKKVEKQSSTFLYQAFIFSLILLISHGISTILPIPMPPSVIGLILLFVALCTKIIKLEEVEGISNHLSTIITFLFVPSGISLINSLDLMKTSGLQIFLIIFVATFVIMALIGWSASFLLKVRRAHSAKKQPEKSTVFSKAKKTHVKEAN